MILTTCVNFWDRLFYPRRKADWGSYKRAGNTRNEHWELPINLQGVHGKKRVLAQLDYMIREGKV